MVRKSALIVILIQSDHLIAAFLNTPPSDPHLHTRSVACTNALSAQGQIVNPTRVAQKLAELTQPFSLTCRYVLCLSAGQTLRQRLALPSELSPTDYTSLITASLTRLFPVPASELCYDFHIEQGAANITVTRRSTVEQWSDLFGRLGLKLQQITAAKPETIAAPTEIGYLAEILRQSKAWLNFLPWRASQVRRQRHIALVIALVHAGSALALMGYLTLNNSQRREAIQQHIASLMRENDQLQTALAERITLDKQVKQITQRQEDQKLREYQRIRLLTKLVQVANQLPITIWFEQMNYHASTLKITGKSMDDSLVFAFVSQLVEAKQFTDCQLVYLHKNQDNYDFELALTISDVG